MSLRDGRALAYREWGDPAGTPVFHCHGIPSCRLEAWGGEHAYTRAGVRLVTMDRPGIGRSDRHPERRVSDWPDDVADLADELRIARFAVLGHSAGTAYALACAARLPDRVTDLALVGAVPPLDSAAATAQLGTARHWVLAARRPRLLASGYALWVRAFRVAPRLGRRLMVTGAAAADRRLFERRDVWEHFRATLLEATRDGTSAVVEDMRALMRPWGFSLADIRVDTHAWHGGDDHHVPPSVAEAYAAAIAHCTVTLVDGEGHFSLAERCSREIVSALVRAHHRR